MIRLGRICYRNSFVTSNVSGLRNPQSVHSDCPCATTRLVPDGYQPSAAAERQQSTEDRLRLLVIVVRIGEADLAEPFHQRRSIVEPASRNHNVVSKHLSNYPLRKKTSRYFHSCIFHPCNFERATFSTPTFSASPIALRHSLYAAREKHRQNYLLFYFLVLFNRPTFPTGRACPCRSSKDERLEIVRFRRVI